MSEDEDKFDYGEAFPQNLDNMRKIISYKLGFGDKNDQEQQHELDKDKNEN